MSQKMNDTPFGRQPKPVKFTLEGETLDIEAWVSLIKARASAVGDDFQQQHANIFTVYPRAVND